MNEKNLSNPKPPEPLPGETDLQLRQLDARLTRDAHRNDIPSGMAGRVFDASVGHLPDRRLRFPDESASVLNNSSTRRRQYWGRMALAASVAVAFGVSWQMFTHSGNGLLEQPQVAISNHPESVSLIGENVFVNAVALSLDTEQVLLDFTSANANDYSYLATRELTLSQLTEEMDNLFAENYEGGM